MSDLKTRFYVRFMTQDYPGVIGSIGTCFGDQAVSLESVVQAGIREGLAEIVVVTQLVEEGRFRLALDRIGEMAAIAEIASVLRVL
jgi:homoserine dehydrogenase